MARMATTDRSQGLTRRRLAGLVLAAATACASPAFAQPSPAASRPGENVVEVVARPALAIQGTADWTDGHAALESAFRRLQAETERAGLKAAGKPQAVFLFTDDMGFRYRGMLPIEEPASAPQLADGFSLDKTPGGRAVKFEHRGAYDDIDATYDAVTAWLDDRNLVAQDFFVEEWLTPGANPSALDAAVDVYVFLK